MKFANYSLIRFCLNIQAVGVGNGSWWWTNSKSSFISKNPAAPAKTQFQTELEFPLKSSATNFPCWRNNVEIIKSVQLWSDQQGGGLNKWFWWKRKIEYLRFSSPVRSSLWLGLDYDRCHNSFGAAALKATRAETGEMGEIQVTESEKYMFHNHWNTYDMHC